MELIPQGGGRRWELLPHAGTTLHIIPHQAGVITCMSGEETEAERNEDTYSLTIM